MVTKELSRCIRVQSQPGETTGDFTLSYYLFQEGRAADSLEYGIEVIKTQGIRDGGMELDKCRVSGVSCWFEEARRTVDLLAEGLVTPYSLDEHLDYILGEKARNWSELI